MSAPFVEITHAVEFSASHRLHNPALSDAENERLFGICNNRHGHGHNYVMEVTVRGRVPAETGMVMDLNVLMRILREKIVARLDHKHLNHDVEYMAGVVPTAESLAVRSWGEIEPELSDYPGAALHRIRVYESRVNFVDYYGPDAH